MIEKLIKTDTVSSNGDLSTLWTSVISAIDVDSLYAVEFENRELTIKVEGNFEKSQTLATIADDDYTLDISDTTFEIEDYTLLSNGTVTLYELLPEVEEFLNERGVKKLWRKIKEKLATKLDLAGGQMTGTLSFDRDMWTQKDTPAIDLNNGDVVNFNGLYAADAATSLSEGINWKNADGQDPQTWDSIWARGGKFYFAPASGDAKEIAHADNIYQLYAFPNGTHSVRAGGIAYSAGNSGEIYVFPNFPRPLPTGKTITLTALTDVTIRGAGKVQVNNETLTSKVKSATRYYNGQFNIQLQNVTTNWSANQMMFFVGTCTFTIS